MAPSILPTFLPRFWLTQVFTVNETVTVISYTQITYSYYLAKDFRISFLLVLVIFLNLFLIEKMDLLRRELDRKKSVLEKAASNSDKSTKRKYWKQSDLRRLEEEQQEEQQKEQEAQRQQLKKEEKEESLSVKRRKTENGADKDISSSSSSSPSNRNETTRSSQHPSTTMAGVITTATDGNKKKKKRSLDEKGSTTTTEPSSSKPKEESSSTPSGGSEGGETGGISTMSLELLKARLRSFGLPISFFGERVDEKEERLKEALKKQDQTLQGLSEMEEFRLGQGYGIRNPFLLEKGKKHDKKGQTLNSTGGGTMEDEKKDGETKRDEEELPQDDKDGDDDDPPKRIYKFLKGLLREWEDDLDARPKSIATSVAGRNEVMTFKQCQDYIRPLFKQLKKRKLEGGMQAHLEKIVEYAKQGEFVKAHDAYMDVAIGRAAWPIGVTMVGIHARSGRAKIESSNVAHVMNSELQRKYLTSVKRLLSYAQKKRPDVDPSKKVT